VSDHGLFPPALIDAVKSEVLLLGREERTRTFSVDYRVVAGVAREARVRSRESLIVVPLTTD
jgi:hypothetical protein